MKKLIPSGYQFLASSRIVNFPPSLYGPQNPVNLESLLLITNVSRGQIIYNFADSTATGIANSTSGFLLGYNTTSMSNNDKLQIFYDVPIEEYDFCSGYLTGYITGSGTSTGLYSSGVPIEFTAMGGRAVDVASGFFPQYGRNANAVLNIDSQGGGALTLQADLDKDIDSVTAFPPVGGYASNYSIQTGTGVILSGNNSRLGWGITNYGTGNIYLKFGAGATVTTGVSFGVTGAIITGSSFNLILKGGNTEFDNNGGNFLDFTPKYNGPVSVANYPNQNIKYISWELV
jgi:hypothetical protein